MYNYDAVFFRSIVRIQLIRSGRNELVFFNLRRLDIDYKIMPIKK